MEKDGSVSMQDLLAGGRLNGSKARPIEVTPPHSCEGLRARCCPEYTAEDVLLVIKHNDKQRFEVFHSTAWSLLSPPALHVKCP